MNLVEWFDIRETDHFMAYKHLMKNGMWPEGFIPDDVEIPNNWQVSLMGNIVDEFIRQNEGRHVMELHDRYKKGKQNG